MKTIFMLSALLFLAYLPVQAQNTTVAANGDTFVYRIDSVEVKPYVPGGALNKYLATIVYPPMARENDIEGTVVVRFIIEKDGHASHVKIVETPIPNVFDDACINHIMAMPKWIPGSQFGKLVRVEVELAIGFDLVD